MRVSTNACREGRSALNRAVRSSIRAMLTSKSALLIVPLSRIAAGPDHRSGGARRQGMGSGKGTGRCPVLSDNMPGGRGVREAAMGKTGAIYRLGCDVGGTFTDFVLRDERTGRVAVHKVPSTPADPSEAVRNGLPALLEKAGADAAGVGQLLHATTVATNAIIQRRGAKTALITTRGFRDVLILGRQKRYETYDLHMRKPEPLIPREAIFEVQERVDHEGKVLAPLDRQGLAAVLERIAEGGYPAVAVVLLHSYANPAHERAIGEAVAARLPGAALSLSVDVSPKLREYERANTTVANSFVKPLVGAYVRRLAADFAAAGAAAELSIMQSNGGIVSPALASDYPVRIVESGPAAGVLLAGQIGRDIGRDRVLSFDMGGTTAKLGAIDDGEPAIAPVFEVDPVKFRKGSGLPINAPAVELIEIGAGGGSLAEAVDGAIRVGPESAGADPGPACYGLGGERPTVTDANLALGYLNPGYFNGGAMALDPAAAEAALRRHVAEPLGLPVAEAAWGVHLVATGNMEHALRVVSVERGRDPRRYALVAFGGAGPLHAARIARTLGVRQVVVPKAAGVGSAVGMLAAESRLDASVTRLLRLDEASPGDIAAIYAGLEARLAEDLARLPGAAKPEFRRFAYMRHAGQGFDIPVDLPAGPIDEGFIAACEAAFRAAYKARYRMEDPASAVEGVDWALAAAIPSPRDMTAAGDAHAMPVAAPPGVRQAWFPEAGGMAAAAVWRREAIGPDAIIPGPAIIEDAEATTVIPPGDRARLGPGGHLLIDIGQAAAAPEERRGGRARPAIDPIAFTVIWNAVVSIAEELGATMRHTAFSEAVREGDDFSTAVFDAQGRMIAQGNFSPGHLGSMPFVIRHVTEAWPPETLKPGDSIMLNDSWMGSGHFPDIFQVMPVFEGAELLGYVAASAHQMDVGGAAPGSQKVHGVTEAFQEGLRILPVRFCREGEIDRDILSMVLANTRVPDKVRGDILAQHTANLTAAARFRQLFRNHGRASVEQAFDDILDRSEARMRAALAAVPPGTYSFDDRMDDYGPGTPPIRFGVDITFGEGPEGAAVTVDFSRSSDQVPAAINSYINYTRAYTLFAIKVFCDPFSPQNAGAMRPIGLVAREGSFFNPRFPAPSGGRAALQVRIFDTINGAMAKAMPERAMGAFSHWSNPNIGGIDDRTGKPYVFYDLILAGYGGRADSDGPEGLSPVMNCSNIPVEVHETNLPVLIHRVELLDGTGGAGRHKGGSGLRKDIELLAGEGVLTLLGDRHKSRPYGVFGGEPGALGETVLNPDGNGERLGSKEIRTLKRGDVLSIRTSGAGGYGRPAEE